eukprot:1332827-Ditylum_brightwellii.AAC.1
MKKAGPQAKKKDAQIKASAGPQAAENKVKKEIKASVGPQAAAKEVVPQAAEKEAVKESQGQVEASAGHMVEKDSPQEPPPPLDRAKSVKTRALATGKSFLSRLVAQVPFL